MLTLVTCPPGWSAPWTGTMTPQDPTPVAIDQGSDFLPFYGWIQQGPLTHLDTALGAEVMVLDGYHDYTWFPPAEDVTETSGCGCGQNPWTLCHPEA